MQSIATTINAIPERSTERLNIRTKKRVKDTIHAAAQLSGVDDSTFILSTAYLAALETISAHERTDLKPIDHQAFFAALDAEPQPTPALRDAFRRHKGRVNPA